MLIVYPGLTPFASTGAVWLSDPTHEVSTTARLLVDLLDFEGVWLSTDPPATARWY